MCSLMTQLIKNNRCDTEEKSKFNNNEYNKVINSFKSKKISLLLNDENFEIAREYIKNIKTETDEKKKLELCIVAGISFLDNIDYSIINNVIIDLMNVEGKFFGRSHLVDYLVNIAYDVIFLNKLNDNTTIFINYLNEILQNHQIQ